MTLHEPTEETPKRAEKGYDVFSTLLEKPIKRTDLIAKMNQAGFAQATATSYISWSKRVVDETEMNPFGFQTDDYRDAEGNRWLVRRGDPAPEELTKITKDSILVEEKEDTVPESPPRPVQFWKIAPGQSASFWDECRDKGFISIGWSEIGDFNAYKDDHSLRQALRDHYDKDGGSRVVRPFFEKIEVGDVVVANKGTTGAVGIGIIKSDYMPQGHPNNPSTHNDLVNARLVDWLITKPISLPEDFFAQTTLTRLRPDQWNQIKATYEATYPGDAEISEGFAALSGPQNKQQPPKYAGIHAVAGKTRNILLYGPPGTGKTHAVNRFKKEFLLPQLVSQDASRSKLLNSLMSLSWWEIVWAAMYTGNKQYYTIRDLLQQPWISKRFAAGTNKNQYSTLTVCMGMMTSPESPYVKFKDPRREPYLFDKTEDTQWFLTQVGKDYASGEGKTILDRLNGAKGNAPTVDDFCTFVTFHQSFAYEEFIEGIKPAILQAMEEEARPIQYKIEPGIFQQIANRAATAWRDAGSPKDPAAAPKFLLIIDEINRANIAKVFGELITLIEDDKRLGQPNELTVTLPYSQQKFGVPPNLYILGTLNTADRSIAQLDLALRRRFTFIEMMPDYTIFTGKFADTLAGVPLASLLQTINNAICWMIDRDHQIGHSYLLVKKADLPDQAAEREALHFAFTYKILPLLQEYFYNDTERLYSLLGESFFQKLPAPPKAIETDEEPRYRLTPPSPHDLPPALQKLLAQPAPPSD